MSAKDDDQEPKKTSSGSSPKNSESNRSSLHAHSGSRSVLSEAVTQSDSPIDSTRKPMSKGMTAQTQRSNTPAKRRMKRRKSDRTTQMRIADYDNEVENRRRFLHMDELSDDEKLTKLHLPNHWNNYNLLGLMLTTKLIWQAPQLVIRHGGYYFLFFNMAFCLFVCFPLLYLSVFVAQNSQVNVVTIFGNHGRAYQGIGYAIVIMTLMNQANGLSNSGHMLKHIMEVIWSNFSVPFGCKKEWLKPKKPGINNKDAICLCFIDDDDDDDEGWCPMMQTFDPVFYNESDPVKRFNDYPTSLYSSNIYMDKVLYSEEGQYPVYYFYLMIVSAMCILVVSGRYAFSTFSTLLCFCCLGSFIGHATWGVLASHIYAFRKNLKVASDIYKATSADALYENLKFALYTQVPIFNGIMAAGSFRPRHSAVFRASVVVTLTTFFCMLIGMLILNNLHMQTDFATARTTTRRPTPMLHRGDSGYRGKNELFFATVMVPEIHLMYGHYGSNIIMYYIFIVMLSLSEISGYYFTVLSILRDLPAQKNWWLRLLRRIGVVLVAGIVAILYTLLMDRWDSQLFNQDFLTCMNIYFALIVTLVLFYTYGPQNLSIDIYRLARRHKSEKSTFIYYFHIFYHILLLVTPVILALALLPGSLAFAQMLYSARSRRSDPITARMIRHIGKAALFLPFLTILVFPIYHIINNIIAHRSKDGNVESIDHLYTPSFLHYRKQKEEQLPYDEEKKNAYGLMDIAKTAQNLVSLAIKR